MASDSTKHTPVPLAPIPQQGHCLNATVKNMQDGNNTIMSNHRKPKSDTQKPTLPKPTEAKTE